MAKARDALGSVLNLRPGEGAPLAAVVVLSFFKGAAAVLFDTAANTHFIALFSASRLPFIYLASAGISLAVGAVYAALAARVDVRRMLLGTLGAASAVVFLVYLGFLLHPAPWLVLGAMVWKEALFILSNMVLWATAGYLFDLRQGKRLFGLVAAGGIGAGIAGGLIVSWLVRVAGLIQLFLFSALALAATAGCLWIITRRFASHFEMKAEGEVHAPAAVPGAPAPPWWHLFRNRYLGLFLSLSILSNFGFFFSDYAYFNRVGNAFHDEAVLAAFFGHFSAVLGAVQLVASLFLSGPIITRFGLGWALMALPVVSGVGMASAAGVSWFAGMNGAFFWLIMATKLGDEALRASLLAPAFRILYQPLPARERLSFQAKTESIIEPLGVGLAGGVLILLTLCWPVALPTLCLILVLILAVWIGVAELLRHEYTRMLTKALSRRRLSGASLEVIDRTASAIFLKGTASANPGEVLYCLGVLEEIADPRWPERLRALAAHPSAQVREYLFQRIEANNLQALADLARAAWKDDPDPAVRRAAMRAHCVLGKEAVVEEVSSLFAPEADPALMVGALTGLLRGGTADGVRVAEARLQAVAADARSAERARAAEVLGESGPLRFDPLLQRLLDDADPQVVRAALRAAGKSRQPQWIPVLLHALSQRLLRPAALAALRGYGEGLIEPLSLALREEKSSGVQRSLIGLLGQLDGEAPRQVLIGYLSVPDKILRGHILRSLTLLRYQAPPETEAQWKELIRTLLREAVWTVETQARFEKAGRWPLLSQALATEVREDQKQILRLLGFFPRTQPLRSLGEKLASPSPVLRAQAVELLENLIPADLKKEVMPLLDGATLARNAARAAEVRPATGHELEEALVRIAEASPWRFQRWPRACALQAIGLEKLAAGRKAVHHGQAQEDAVIRETAAWAAGQCHF